MLTLAYRDVTLDYVDAYQILLSDRDQVLTVGCARGAKSAIYKWRTD